jgi:hypothetical protein
VVAEIFVAANMLGETKPEKRREKKGRYEKHRIKAALFV